MTSQADAARVYGGIADIYERRGQGQMRDRFLVLAADAAHAAGKSTEAESFRQRLLQASPHHLLKPYESFSQAIQSPDLMAYIQDLRRHYPPDAAEELLGTLKREDETSDAGKAASPSAKPPSTRPPEQPAPVYRIRDDKKNPQREDAALAATMPPGSMAKVAAEIKAAQKSAGTAADKGRPSSRPDRPPPRPLAPVVLPGPLSTGDEPDTKRDEFEQGAWLASLLFGVLTCAGLLWLAYTVARPFLSGGPAP